MLTPGQIAELRSDIRVRGTMWVDGGLHPAYTIRIGNATMERVQVLANARAVPQHVSWFAVMMAPDRVEIYTTAPEWFAEIEEQINAARRPIQPTW